MLRNILDWIIYILVVLFAASIILYTIGEMLTRHHILC